MNLNSIYTKILYVAYFFFSWGIGFTVYSNSKVIEIVTGRESIGIVYGISAALSLVLSTWATPRIITLLGNRKSVGIAIILSLLSLAGISLLSNGFLVAVSFILFFASQILISFSFDVFFEHNTLKQSSAQARGIVVALQHIGRMLGPMLAAVITVRAGIQAPYKISFILLAVTGIFLYIATKTFKDKSYIPISLINSIKVIVKRPDILKPLTSILLLQIFYALMVAFVPIYLLDVQGIDSRSLGILFTIMLLPFVLLGYPIGKSLDKGSSGRRAARYGLIIMSITTFMFPLIHTKSLLVWGIILVISRIGAVILETAGEGIFFRSIREEETELLGIMRDMQPVGYFIASCIGIIVLLIGSLSAIFYVIGVILIIGIITTHKKKIYAHK